MKIPVVNLAIATCLAGPCALFVVNQVEPPTYGVLGVEPFVEATPVPAERRVAIPRTRPSPTPAVSVESPIVLPPVTVTEDPEDAQEVLNGIQDKLNLLKRLHRAEDAEKRKN